MTITGFIFSCFLFYLPAALANMGAVVSRFIPFFNTLTWPVDSGMKINDQRIVGDHKTIGGYLFGVLVGTLAGIVKYMFLDHLFPSYVLYDLSLGQNIVLYLLMANGALLGDIAKSILKRQLRIPPHSPWIPFDEIDHSVVSLLFACLIVPVSLTVYLTVVIVYFLIHVVSNIFGFWLKIKQVPY